MNDQAMMDEGALNTLEAQAREMEAQIRLNALAQATGQGVAVQGEKPADTVARAQAFFDFMTTFTRPFEDDEIEGEEAPEALN